MSVLAEFRRRNVHRVALGYLAGAWLLIQIADTIFPRIGLSDATVTFVIVLLGIGFLPAVVLSWVFEWTPEGLRRESALPESGPQRSTKAFDRAITVILVLAVGYFAVDKFVVDPARDAAEIEQAREDARRDAKIEEFGERSIIVLPFLNMSPDPDQEYFTDGITEELLNLLAGITRLRVISRSTAWTFKGKPVDIAAIREKLDVSHVLEGSVRKSGDRVRITAQLIDANTDTHLWSETYDRRLDDIFEIQDDISARIVAELQLKLVGGAPKAIEIDPRAYELYLQARYIVHNFLEDQRDDAEAMLRKVLEIEPEFVPALWELTRAVNRRGEPLDAESKAVRDGLIERMVEIAPDSSYANGWLAHRAWHEERDIQAAAHYIEKAIAGGTDWNRWFQITYAARFLTFLGRTKEAVELTSYIAARDPACVGCLLHHASVLRESNRHEEAAEVLEQVLEWHRPNLVIAWTLGVAWLVTGDYDKALQSFEMISDEGQRELGRLLTLAKTGPPDRFETEFAHFRQANPDNAEGIARIYAWSGQADEAFEWLERMVEQLGPGAAGNVKTDLYEPIKSDPRWAAFLEKYGVPDVDYSHIVFDPKLPDVGWVPAEIRPASPGG